MTIWDAIKELMASRFVVFIVVIIAAAIISAALADWRARREDEYWKNQNLLDTEEYWRDGVRFTRPKRKDLD